jgi:hypothetical protein
MTGINAIEYIQECLLDERIVELVYPIMPDGLEQGTITQVEDDEQIQVFVDDLLERQDMWRTSRHHLVVKYFGSSMELLFRGQFELGDALDGIFPGMFMFFVDSTVDRASCSQAKEGGETVATCVLAGKVGQYHDGREATERYSLEENEKGDLCSPSPGAEEEQEIF